MGVSWGFLGRLLDGFWYTFEIKQPINKFAGLSGAKPIGVLDLKYWSFGCLVDPPLPPQCAPGAAHVHPQCVSWGPGRSIFLYFFRFDFRIDFGFVLGPVWARLGRFLGAKIGSSSAENAS